MSVMHSSVPTGSLIGVVIHTFLRPRRPRSVGCIFGELLLRRPLLMGSGEIDQVDKICKLLGSPTVEQWPGLVDMPDARLVGKKLSSINVRPVSARICAGTLGSASCRFQRMLCGRTQFDQHSRMVLMRPCRNFTLNFKSVVLHGRALVKSRLSTSRACSS